MAICITFTQYWLELSFIDFIDQFGLWLPKSIWLYWYNCALSISNSLLRYSPSIWPRFVFVQFVFIWYCIQKFGLLHGLSIVKICNYQRNQIIGRIKTIGNDNLSLGELLQPSAEHVNIQPANVSPSNLKVPHWLSMFSIEQVRITNSSFVSSVKDEKLHWSLK